MDTAASHRLDRTARLLGTDAMDRLAAAHVVVLGVGGVGSFTAEALVRAGVGRVTLVDGERVDETNANRQLHALDGAFGELKVAEMAARLARVNPAGGNLLVARRDLDFDTRLGNVALGATWNSATGAWRWSFELSYDGALFVDASGARYAVAGVADGAAIPGSVWVRLGTVAVVFGVVGLALSALDIRRFIRPAVDRNAWWFSHMAGMLGSYIAAVTAFSVVNFAFLPTTTRWLWPTVIGSPLPRYSATSWKASR